MDVKAIAVNKQLWLAFGSVVFIGAVVASGTGAFFSSQATATGNNFTAGTLELQMTREAQGSNPETTKDAEWVFTNMAPGGTPSEESIWLRNVGSISGATLGVQAQFAGQGSIAQQMRITELSLDGQNLLTGGAGADMSLYEAPVSCDVEVNFGNNDFTRISSAVDAATPGQTICVGPGNYSVAWEAAGSGFPIRIDVDNVRVVSVGGPAVTTVGGGFTLDNPGVALSGFTINGESTLLEETFAVYVNGAAVGSEVSFNNLMGAGTVPSRGIVTATGVSNVTIEHIDSQNWATGIYVNPSSSMTVQYNTLTNNNVGMSNDNPSGNTVQYNHIENNAIEGVGIALALGNTLTFERNNIIGNGVDVAQYGTETVVAENNWWGSFTPATQVTGDVDTTNFAGGPFVGYVNGTDANGNGYADLHDLRAAAILGITPGLDPFTGANDKEFKMAVQLDGPTTGNTFQGQSLDDVTIEFTLNQI